MRPLAGLMSTPRWHGAAAEWYWLGKTDERRGKPDPVSRSPPQIPQRLPWKWTWASAMRSRWLPTWAVARGHVLFSTFIAYLWEENEINTCTLRLFINTSIRKYKHDNSQNYQRFHFKLCKCGYKDVLTFTGCPLSGAFETNFKHPPIRFPCLSVHV
jgi:hypothetical protein